MICPYKTVDICVSVYILNILLNSVIMVHSYINDLYASIWPIWSFLYMDYCQVKITFQGDTHDYTPSNI